MSTVESPGPRLTVACSECGRPMVERTNRQNGSTFLGCSSYPDCTSTQDVPAYLHQLRAGAAPLPGMEDL